MPNFVSSSLTSSVLQYSRDLRRRNLEEHEGEEDTDDDVVVTADVTSEDIVNIKKEIVLLKSFIHQTLNDMKMVTENHRLPETKAPELDGKFDVHVVMNELESRIKMVDLETKQEIAELKSSVNRSIKERESKLENELQEQVSTFVMDIENRMRTSMEESLQQLYQELDKNYKDQSEKKMNAGRRRIKYLKRKLLSNSKKSNAKVAVLRKRVAEMVQKEDTMSMELERSKNQIADLKMKNSSLETQEMEDNIDFTTMIPNSMSIIKHPEAESSSEKLHCWFSRSSSSSSPFNSSPTKVADDRSNKTGKFYSKIKKIVLGKDNQNLKSEFEKVSHDGMERRRCTSDSGFPSKEAGTVMVKSGKAARNPTVLFRC